MPEQLPVNPSPSPAPPATGLPTARAALGLLLAINLFNYVDRQVLAAVVPRVKETLFSASATAGGVSGQQASVQAWLDWCQGHFGFSPKDALIGVLSMAFMVVYMIGAPVFGRLAERRSRWMLIGLGVVLWSLASGASGLASTFAALLITRCLVGIGEAAYGPVAPTIIADLYPVQKRGQVLAWFYMAIPVGSALGYVLGGMVAKSSLGDWGHHLFGWRAESWRWAFYLVVLPGLALGVWSFFMRDPPRGQVDLAKAAPAHKAEWRDYLVLVRTPSYVLCTLGMAAMTFAIGGIAFWMPDYLETYRGLQGDPTTLFGAVLVVSGLAATLLGGLAGDKLRNRFPGSYFLVSGIAMLLGLPAFLAVLVTPAPWLWVFIFLACFCLFFNTGPTNTILANVTHPSIRATAFALSIFVIHALGDVISPVIIGLLNDRFHDMNKAFLAVGVMFPISGVLWLLGVRHLARDTALASTRLGKLPVASTSSAPPRRP
jgi:MFS transporter, Spinster family, sphingosine-1-phosphate transporter